MSPRCKMNMVLVLTPWSMLLASYPEAKSEPEPPFVLERTTKSIDERPEFIHRSKSHQALGDGCEDSERKQEEYYEYSYKKKVKPMKTVAKV